MEQYISKSALAAEIERRIKEIDEIGTYLSSKGILTNLLCHIDTLEVRKIDFTNAFIEKALKWIDYTFHETSIDGFGGESVDVVMSDTSIYKDDLLESFKNYMEGE